MMKSIIDPLLPSISFVIHGLNITCRRKKKRNGNEEDDDEKEGGKKCPIFF